MTVHDEHWGRVKEEATQTIVSLFASCDVPLKSVLRHTRGVTTREDVEASLAYLLKHGSACEVACGIIACGDWIQAENELSENFGSAGAVSK